MKRVLSVVIVVCFFMSMTTVSGASKFEDVKTSDWYYDNVVRLAEDSRAIIGGYPDGTFKPYNQLNRDQFITMVVRAAGFEPGNAEGYWAQNYIDKALELGFVVDGEFSDYNSEITREEMCLIVVRVVEYLDGSVDVSDLTEVLQVVTDSEDFTFKYEESIMQTYKLGIITGYPDHTFRPQAVLNRSEASAVMVRLIDVDERKEFDFDALYADLYPSDGEFEEHLLGGSLWVDPVTSSDRVSAEEDWGLITSDMSYSPTEQEVESGRVLQLSSDLAYGTLMYDENGAYAGQVEDFERLLLRRVPEDQVEIVMKYLREKKNSKDYLEHRETFFYIDNERYIVKLQETIMGKNTQWEQATAINFNIWYRDSNFINNYEEDITYITTGSDILIYR